MLVLVRPQVKFLTERTSQEWWRLHPMVQQFVREADAFLGNAGHEAIITCIWRSHQENDELYGGHGDHLYGPHVFFHAADLRTRDLEASLRDSLADFLIDRWIYDRARPKMVVALLEGGPADESLVSAGSTGPHLHLQALPGVTMPRPPS